MKMEALRGEDRPAREHGLGLLKIASWRVSSVQMRGWTSQGRVTDIIFVLQLSFVAF